MRDYASKSPKRLLIVGDTPQFGRTVSQILAAGDSLAWSIRHTTYDGFRGMLSPRLLRETDLFVLDLWRSYPTGIRAEGVAVAEQLSRHHSKSLIVSPLSISAEGGISGYWDIASTMPLAQSCDLLLKQGRRKHAAVPEILRKALFQYLAAPAGHEAVPRSPLDF